MGKKIGKTLVYLKRSILYFIYPAKAGCVNCGEESFYDLCYSCRDSIKRDETKEAYGGHGGALAKMIRNFKLFADFDCGRVLATFLVETIKENNFEDYILTYVPMSKKSEKKRGFNQSEYLCSEIALQLNISFKKTLVKIRDTKAQKGCLKDERKNNVKGAFRAENKGVKGNCFLIIDDVMTTGATLKECKKALLLAGAKDVRVLTVSKSNI